MIRRLHPIVAVATLLLSHVAVIAAAPPADTATRNLQQRIDALLKQRLKPEPLPVTPPNPFQVTGGAKRETSPDDAPPRAAPPAERGGAASVTTAEGPAKDLANVNPSEVLIACATKLKLGGVLILKEQLQIVVNGTPRKEGDVIPADWNNSIIYLRVARLLPGQLVLRYGEAEVTMKF